MLNDATYARSLGHLQWLPSMTVLLFLTWAKMDASSKSQCRDGSGVFFRTRSAVRRYTAWSMFAWSQEKMNQDTINELPNILRQIKYTEKSAASRHDRVSIMRID